VSNLADSGTEEQESCLNLLEQLHGLQCSTKGGSGFETYR
jgi:hypothetical protein